MRALSFTVFIAWTLAAIAAAAPFLKMKNAVAGAGDNVIVSVQYSSGTEDVAALQFDLVMPQGITAANATEGPAAVAAQKQVASNLLIPRILVYGLNALTIQSGDLVLMDFKLQPQLPPGQYNIDISNPIYSSPAGTEVVGSPSSGGTITVIDQTAPARPRGLRRT